MRVSVFGLGYVGCVSAACLASEGHEVVGVDVNRQKVDQVAGGRSPILEPGLDALIAEAVRSGALRATDDGQAAARATDLSLICVGTPSKPNGSLNLRYVEHVCAEIGMALEAKPDYHAVVVRSTVLPGTSQQRLIPILEQHSGRSAGPDFGYAFFPEFLREGSAIADFRRPSQVVIGGLDERTGDLVEQLSDPAGAPVTRVPIGVAEMVKYTSNAFHALKVAFANEIGSVAKAVGVDGQRVMEIVCRDTRLNISPAYLRPGFAFGGSCLPKDLRALLYRARERDIETPVLSAVMTSNQAQIQRAIGMVEQQRRRKVGVLGLSFKAGTDDVRESPVVPLVETLVGRGYGVCVYDEMVDPSRLIGANKSFLEQELPHIASLMRGSIDDVLAESEVVVIANGSNAFRDVAHRLRPDQVLVDLVGSARDNGTIEDRYDGIAW